MKRLLLPLLAAAAILCSCTKTIQEFELKSFELVSVTPEGADAANALVRLTLFNPTSSFEISGAKATLMIGDSPAATISADQLIVSGKTEKEYMIPVKVQIPRESNIFSLLTLLKPKDVPALSLSVSGKVAMRGGVGVNLNNKIIPLDGIMDVGSFTSSIAGAGFKDITVNSFEVCMVEPVGTDSVEILVKLSINNPRVGFEVSALSGTLKFDRKDGIAVSSDDLIVVRKGEKNYYIALQGRFAEGFNPCSILNLLKETGRPELSADLSVRLAARGGLGKTLNWENIPLGALEEGN